MRKLTYSKSVRYRSISVSKSDTFNSNKKHKELINNTLYIWHNVDY